MRIRDEYLHGSDLTGVVKKIEVTIGTGNNANKSVIKYTKADSEGGIVEVPIGDITGKAATASKLDNTSAIGSKINPVYFTEKGVPSACTYSLNATVPAGAANKVLYYSASNTLDTQSYSTLTSNLDVFTVATSSAAGKKGLVPAPAANQLGAGNFFLRADGVWTVIESKSAALNGTATSLVTTGEKYNWNSAYNWYNSMTSGDTDGIINKWKEVEAFLANYGDSSTLAAELAKLVTLSTDQTITGVKTFSEVINGSITGNADTVDNMHASDFSYNNISANYDCNDLPHGTHSATYRFSITPINAFPNAAYGNLLVIGSGADTVSQIGAPYNEDNLYFRSGTWYSDGGSIRTNTWKAILHSENYNSYAPKLDGTGATGNWGINISGNASTATKLQTARTIWGQSFDGTGNVNGTLTEVGSIIPLTDKSYGIGQKGNEFDSGDIHVLYSRHLESSRTFTNDKDLYIQYKQKGNTLMLVNGGNVGVGTINPSSKLHVDGDIYTTTGFKKEGSNDNHVLLGGGGHKALTDFSMAHEHPYLSLSGGKVTGNIEIETDSITGLVVYRNNSIYSCIHFYNTQDSQKVDVGYLGSLDNGNPVYINSGGGVNYLLHSDNYNNYAPTLTGKGASGTWGINISGNATNADKLANITASEYFKNRDYAFNSEWGGSYLWTLWDNHLYAADKRFAVTLTGIDSTYLSPLFDGSFESSIEITEAQSVLHIKHTMEGQIWTTGLPYGSFYVVFYNSDAENVTGRVYCEYAPQGIGWHDLHVTHVRQGVWELHNGLYQLSDLEITITKPASISSLSLCQVLHEVERSKGPYYAAVMSKYCNQKTDYSIEAAKFIGPLQGNADTATNVDWSGVTNRPTNVSAFYNDKGYLTSHAYSYGSIDIYDVNGAKKTSNNTVSASVNTETLRLQEGANIAITATNSGDSGSDSIKIAVTGITSNIDRNGYGQLALWYNGASKVSATLQSSTFEETLTVKAGSGIDFIGVNGTANNDVWTISAIPYNCAITLNTNSTKSLIKDSWSTDALSIYLTSDGTSSGTSLVAGTYALWIEDRSSSSGTPNYYSGTFTCAGSATAGRLDEIALHSSMATSADTNAPTRIFVATQISSTSGKHVLRFCSLDSSATNHYLTVKVNRLI